TAQITVAAGPAIGRCSIEVPIGALNEPRDWEITVRAARLRAETVEVGQRAGRGDFEDRATTESRTTALAGAAGDHRPTEVSVRSLNEGGLGIGAVGYVETYHRGKGLCRQAHGRRDTKRQDDTHHFQ